MSQARAKSFKTAKSLDYLYKVYIPTSYTYEYGSFSSVKIFSTLISAATDHEIFHLQNPNQFPNSYAKYLSFRETNNSEYAQNPNKFYRDTSSGFHRILDHHNSYGIYNASTYNNQKSIVYAHFQIPSRSYSGMVIESQTPSYSHPNEKNSDHEAAGEEKRLLEEFDAFCKDQKLMEAVEVLGLLEQHKVSVDIPRYLFLMNECGESQALEEAKHVHHHLTRSLPYLDVYIHNKILEMYLKCGSIEDAYDLFDEMPQRNLTSWDTIITWLAKNGHGEDAIEMFEEFKSFGLKPDNQIFHGVFAACSVVGDMKEGLLHFESMIKIYNLVPSMDDYVSVVDMIASSGSLDEALEFIEKMPIKPSVEIWEIMMNQSRVHGDLQLGDHCAELVNLLDPSSLDEQSKAGFIPKKPSDIAKVKKNSSRFNPIEMKAHQFRAGDTSHPDHEKIYRQLWCLKQTMLEAGYVPQTSGVCHTIDEESKEEALLLHGERLALSHALLTSPARCRIRIFRNFRLGHDSHNALKIISKLLGRSFLVRDIKRYHHFENGVCSCGDYW